MTGSLRDWMVQRGIEVTDYDERIVADGRVYYLRSGLVVMGRLQCRATNRRTGERCTFAGSPPSQLCRYHRPRAGGQTVDNSPIRSNLVDKPC